MDLKTLFRLSALGVLSATLSACGGGGDAAPTVAASAAPAASPAPAPAPAPTPAPAPAPSPSAAAGPAATADALKKLCSSVTPMPGGGTMYTFCKASATSADNTAVFDPVNSWLAAHRAAARLPLLPGTITSNDTVAGVSKGDDCDMSLEPFLGMLIGSYQKGAVVKPVQFTGLATDEIDTDKDGNIIYMHAGDFATTNGGAEINFPGVTGGTLLESVYGSANKFLMCKMN
jgi:hypothetical protein